MTSELVLPNDTRNYFQRQNSVDVEEKASCGSDYWTDDEVESYYATAINPDVPEEVELNFDGAQ